MKNDVAYSKTYVEFHTPEAYFRNKQFLTLTLNTHAAFPKDKNAKIIDVGCGVGDFMRTMIEHGYDNIMGIDIDDERLNKAREHNLCVQKEDALTYFQNLDKDMKFDAIYMLDFLEHLPKETMAPILKGAYEHLDDNGFLFIQTPNAMCPTATYFRYIDFTHITSFTDNALRGILMRVGFAYNAIRPHLQENPVVQALKLPWARLYRYEYGLEHFILTPNFVSMSFKSEKTYRDWVNTAPEICNDYLEQG